MGRELNLAQGKYPPTIGLVSRHGKCSGERFTSSAVHSTYGFLGSLFEATGASYLSEGYLSMALSSANGTIEVSHINGENAS